MSSSDQSSGRAQGAHRDRELIEREPDEMALLPRKRLAHVLSLIEDPAKRAEAEAEFDVSRSFFTLRRARFEYWFEGELIEFPPYYNFDRGDAVAVLPFDLKAEEVFIVEQARPPVLGKPDSGTDEDGWIIETVAGMPRADDMVSPEPFDAKRVCALRELWEETSIDIRGEADRLWPRDADEGGPMARFFPSPGGSSEEIFVFLADVTDRVPAVVAPAGRRDEGEATIVHRLKIDAFLKNVDAGRYHDSKIYAAAVMLRHYLAMRQAKAAEAERQVARWRFLDAGAPTERVIELRPGDILGYDDFDVWANSEDPTLAMNRMHDRSISSLIRRRGAIWYEEDEETYVRLLEDTIAVALAEERRRFGGRPDVGDVFLTTSGSLLLSHNVRRIAHVVAVENRPDGGHEPFPHKTEAFAREVLTTVHKWNADNAGGARRFWRESPLVSVMLPFFGAGRAAGDPRIVADGLVRGVQAFWSAEETRGSQIARVGLSCFLAGHYDEAAARLDTAPDVFERIA